MKIIISEIKRLASATRFSLQGLKHAWKGEAAFRFEVCCSIFLLPIAILLDLSSIERIALVASVFLVLIVELLNSAVEAAIDRISEERHPISGKAKDMGSAAVFVALILMVFTWLTVLWEAFI